MRVALVVNPFATRVNEEWLTRVREQFRGACDLDVALTERSGHAAELVAAACRDSVDAVVVFSGDGVFNEALNGLTGDTPIGFLPGGGTSVLPRALGLPRDPVAAARRLADALAAGRTRRISLGRVNGRRFGFAAGVGLPAEFVRRVDALGRRHDGRRPGDVAFTGAVLRVIAGHRGRVEPLLEVVGVGRAACAFVANGAPYTYAGAMRLPIAPDADFEGGLDLVAPERFTPASLPATAMRLLRGRHDSLHDLDRIEIRCDRPLPLQVDGEDLGDVEEALFEAERSAVSVLY